MRSRTRTGLCAAAAGACCMGFALSAGPPEVTGGGARLAVARDRATLLHGVYSATLDAMHHHYFRRDRAVLPARAMEDVFADVAERSKVKARWIAVNTRAMSLDHQPKNEFDRKAAAEIAAGKGTYERVEGGVYLRAGAVPLASGCVGCHEGFSAPASKTPRFAGLVISVPLGAD